MLKNIKHLTTQLNLEMNVTDGKFFPFSIFF
jgi:hypothetical protein